MSEEEVKLLKEVIEVWEDINESKINSEVSEEWTKNKTKIHNVLLMAGVIWGSLLGYNWDSRANVSNSNWTSFSGAIDTNHTDKKIENKKMYDKSTFIRDFFKLYEGKTDVNNALFSQWDLEGLLLTYEKTKNLLWKSSREAVRLILKDMFISILKEWYQIDSYKDLDKLRSNIMFFSRWEIEIEYSDNMPKNVEFEEEIIIEWELKDWNILLIKQVSKLNFILKHIDTNYNVLKNEYIFDLLDAYYKDLPTGISDLSEELDQANSRANENFINLSSAKSELKAQEIVMSGLNLKIDNLKEKDKKALLDLKDKYEIILKKKKKEHLEEIDEINEKNNDNMLKLEDNITILNINNSTSRLALQVLIDNNENNTVNFNKKIDKLNESKIELKVSEVKLKDEVKNLKDEIKDLKYEIKDLKDELSIQDKKNGELVRTIKLNSLKKSNREKEYKKEIDSKELTIDNNIVLIETLTKKIKILEEKTKK